MKFNLSTKEIAAQLRTSESTLRRLRKSGVLRPGIHFVGTGTGQKAPQLLWCLPAIEEALAKRSRRVLTA